MESTALDPKRVPGSVLGVLRRLREAGHEGWLVGGAVRDLLRGAPKGAADWDVATSAHPEAVRRLFRRVVPTGIEHGTVTVLTGDGPVEVTTFRGEGDYTDARRPDRVEFLDRIEDDLARRDFTVNAIAWDPLEGRVVDPFGGRRDLKRGLVRAVGDPLERFAEDGLRPMRAVRFAAVLEMDLDPATQAAIPPRLDRFQKVAAERIRQELDKLLVGRRAAHGVALMAETGLLPYVLPEADASPTGLARLEGTPPELVVRLAALLEGTAPERAATALDRLRQAHAIRDRVVALLAAPGWREVRSGGEAALRRALAAVGPENGEALAALWAAEGGEAAEVAGALRRVGAEAPPVRVRDLALGGREVMEHLGLRPGPEVGRLLGRLLEAVLDDPSLNDPGALRSLLDRWSQDA